MRHEIENDSKVSSLGDNGLGDMVNPLAEMGDLGGRGVVGGSMTFHKLQDLPVD